MRWVSVLVVLAVVAVLLSPLLAAKGVAVAFPEQRQLAETIASSGVVQGHKEVVVGAQTAGIVTKLFVEEGEQVSAGQVLAQIQNNVADQQVMQAERALETAKAVLTQSTARALPSEFAAARARVSQAESAIRQQGSALERSRLAESIANSNEEQARIQSRRAEAALSQAQARLDLAKKTLDRKSELAQSGAIALADLDSAQAAFNLAQEDVASAEQALDSAHLSIVQARSGVSSATEDIQVATSQLASAKAQARIAESDLTTLSGKPRSVDVQVARRRVLEAEAALATARVQTGNTRVLAPFAGTVTVIVAEAGSSPSSGVLKLVQTGRLEIRLDLDEAILRDVKVGQRATATASSLAGEVQAHVTRIGSQIDSLRGTLEVYVTTDEALDSLRPGQTLNVNVVTSENAKRLLVPNSAVQREGDQTLIYVLKDGRAIATPVRLGLVMDDHVAVLEGLRAEDLVIQNSYQIANGVRVKRSK